MNKRIIALAEQAYGIDAGKPFHPSALVALEKFAELIVQECIDQVTWKTQKERIIEHMKCGKVRW
jgi:hypothetical protein